MDEPADDPDSSFELVAVNLEWTFAAGSGAYDAVDQALVREVGGPSPVLYRAWVRDPGSGWVRVIMMYVDSGSTADVERARDRVVDVLQQSGGKRCCVEIVGSSDVGDVHRWLEERSVALTAATPPATSAPPAPVRAAPAAPATQPTAQAQDQQPRPTLPQDTIFTPGPGKDVEFAARLVEWASTRPGVIGLVSAATEIGGEQVLVVGVVVEGGVDQDAVRAEAAAVVGPGTPHVVEPFAPSAGMTPQHLRLYRGSRRLWTRPVERPTPASGPARLDTAHRTRVSGVDKVLEAARPVTDERLDSGFTIVGLDLNTSLEQGKEEPDERDRAVVEWVRQQDHALAVLRALTREPRGSGVPVYTVLVDAAADVRSIRHGVAEVVAGTGADRCAVEVFCPFQKLSVFHVRLYGGSLNLWKTDRRRAADSG